MGEVLSTGTEIVAIHAALLPTSEHGEILCFGDWNNPGPTTHTRLFNVADETIAGFPMADLPTTNAFCGGQALLADGRLLVGGGTANWPDIPADEPLKPGEPHGHHYNGERHCWIYLPRAAKWMPVGSFNFQPGSSTKGGGRWYPTLVTLGNGHAFATAGHPDVGDDHLGRHNNNTPETYSPSLDKWKLLGGDITAPSPINSDSYPRFHVLPNGLLFSDTAGIGPKRSFDTATGKWVGVDVDDDAVDHDFYDRGSSASSVLLALLPPTYAPRVMMCNGAQAFRIDVDDSPTWVPTSARTGAAAGKVRHHACAVLLPTGSVFLSGGVSPSPGEGQPVVPVLDPEIYDPGIDWPSADFSGDESWATFGEPAEVARGYHSSALLLPDGRVWTAGSTEGGIVDAESRIEIFSPDYVDEPGRPQITAAPDNVGYGQVFAVDTPSAGAIERVAMLRCGSVTHAFDADQRYVGLVFEKDGDHRLEVTAPATSTVAPPGWYMLWIVDTSDRPCSLARFVRLSHQRCEINNDVSTYSRHEVEALGTPGATFTSAFYVVFDAFLPSEVTTPTLTLRRPDNSAVPGVSLALHSVAYEAGEGAADVAQRIVYAYDVVFDTTKAFDEMPANEDVQNLTLRMSMRLLRCQTTLVLSKNPNPFLRDGDPPWLSVDLRVFSAAAPSGSGEGHPFATIQELLADYNDAAGEDGHPFDALALGQEASRLALYSEDANGDPVYNYAVARVGYRAPVGVDADDVAVFFRICTTGWTALDYDVNASYRRAGNGADAAPLLGLVGGEVNTVPCFAEPRVAAMATQEDSFNRQDLIGAGAEEVHRYFGCVLDINDDVPRFPLAPSGDGPFAGDLRSIQELMRGLHQCLVAEIHWPSDPIQRAPHRGRATTWPSATSCSTSRTTPAERRPISSSTPSR